jgi:hypothetical protein
MFEPRFRNPDRADRWFCRRSARELGSARTPSRRTRKPAAVWISRPEGDTSIVAGFRTTMHACVDVGYDRDRALAAFFLFEEWTDAVAARELRPQLSGVAPYLPGGFYRHELPCLLAVLDEMESRFRRVVIDGYGWLDGAGRPGLGGHLFAAQMYSRERPPQKKTAGALRPPASRLRGPDLFTIHRASFAGDRGAACGMTPTLCRFSPQFPLSRADSCAPG